MQALNDSEVLAKIYDLLQLNDYKPQNEEYNTIHNLTSKLDDLAISPTN